MLAAGPDNKWLQPFREAVTYFGGRASASAGSTGTLCGVNTNHISRHAANCLLYFCFVVLQVPELYRLTPSELILVQS